MPLSKPTPTGGLTEENFAQRYVVEGGRVYLRADLKAQDEKDRAAATAFEKGIEQRLKDASPNK